MLIVSFGSIEMSRRVPLSKNRIDLRQSRADGGLAGLWRLYDFHQDLELLPVRDAKVFVQLDGLAVRSAVDGFDHDCSSLVTVSYAARTGERGASAPVADGRTGGCLPDQDDFPSREHNAQGRPNELVSWTLLQVLYWVGVPPRTLARLYAPIRGRAVGRR